MDLNIIHIWFWENFNLNFVINYLFFWFFLLISIIVFFVWKLFKHDIELSLNFAKAITVKIKPNYIVSQIAHNAWTELMTRKAWLKFEKNHDVIVEVYNSWYTLFSELRKLIKDIPASKIKDKNVQSLVDILILSLNEWLRPHLTVYQAKFRKWYDIEINKEESFWISPQEIQKKYPEYDELVKDLLKVNKKFIKYSKELEKLFK